jgi:F0F1-type ATP synthase membrane subunit b/b'
MENKNEEQVQSSLIPGIREQEGQLQDELKAVKEQALQLLEQARKEAGVTLEKARDGFSASVERLRDERLESVLKELEAEKAGAQVFIQQFEDRTSARIPETVQKIMGMVLPEGTA